MAKLGGHSKFLFVVRFIIKATCRVYVYLQLNTTFTSLTAPKTGGVLKTVAYIHLPNYPRIKYTGPTHTLPKTMCKLTPLLLFFFFFRGSKTCKTRFTSTSCALSSKETCNVRCIYFPTDSGYHNIFSCITVLFVVFFTCTFFIILVGQQTCHINKT